MRVVEKIEVAANVRHGMEKPLAYLFARADRGGAGWIGRLDAPKGETFGGILFYAEKGGTVLHVLPLAETEGKMGMELWPICEWTSERQDDHSEEFLAYMPPATAYGDRRMMYRISLTPPFDAPDWWIEQCRYIWRRLREGMSVIRFSKYRREVEDAKRDMLLRWRMGEQRPAPRHAAWRLDWMVGAGMTTWDMVRRETTYPMEKDNPVGRKMMAATRADTRRHAPTRGNKRWRQPAWVATFFLSLRHAPTCRCG